MPSARVEICFYHFVNPNVSSRPEIDLVDRVGKFDLELVRDDYWPVYRLEIHDTTEFGFDSRHQSEQAIQDLVSAINLRILSAAATRRITRVERCSINYTEAEKEERGDQYGLELGLGEFNQPVSEDKVFDTYGKIQGLDRESIKAAPDVTLVSKGGDELPSVGIEEWVGDVSVDDIEFRGVNLRKALLAYDGAIDANHKAIQHLLLFIALEAATDAWGDDLRGSDLEEAISDVSDFGVDYIEHWRNIYHRQKHPDFDEDQFKASVAALTSRGINNHRLREATIRVILSRLYE